MRSVGLSVWSVIIALALLGLAGCAAMPPSGPAPTAETPATAAPANAVASSAALPTAANPITLTVWHRWTEEEAGTLRTILDDYEKSRPGIRVVLAGQPDRAAAKSAGGGADLLILPGDLIAESVAAGQIAPLDAYVDAAWLEENYIPAAVDALRDRGKLWGLPLNVQALTFFYNQKLIADNELVAQTSQLVERARAYAVAHPGVSYLAYPARADAYFAAPWFYGAGAWYGKADGTVGLNTPAGQEAAAFIASLRQIMPADVDYAKADALFKAGRAAITVNGPWYVSELEKAGIAYGLQIMPIVSSSRQPARPLATADGAMLAAGAAQPVEAVRLIAYLAGSESELRLARKHRMTPANKIAAARAKDEGLNVVAHFAQQAMLAQAMPAATLWGATLAPVTNLLQALWDGKPPAEALPPAQTEAENLMRKALQ
jgi:maltose-binding protein MalE